MTSIAQINENEQSEITGTLKKFFADYKGKEPPESMLRRKAERTFRF